jgi:phosphoribosylaminoimidazolecarboxamide formyltransferase/IMP cyclohydrolase
MAPIALISVSDKSGIEDFGRALSRLGWSLLSTGGTAAILREAGCEVTDVSGHTGFPEILDGRVKTLHPKVFGGILATSSEGHAKQLRKHEIPMIDMVVVNLYPFVQTVARDDATLAEAIEQIDIGGPSLIRAAAKNHDRVVVIVDPGDYSSVLAELAEGQVGEDTRRRLAVTAFRHTSAYDANIAAHLPRLMGGTEPVPAAVIAGRLLSAEEDGLRYGENPHQVGVVVRSTPLRGLAGARQVQGKALSYNNLCDATPTRAGWRWVRTSRRRSARLVPPIPFLPSAGSSPPIARLTWPLPLPSSSSSQRWSLRRRLNGVRRRSSNARRTFGFSRRRRRTRASS